MQMKDQIGTYNYYPSTLMHRAAGGFGGFNILARPVIPIPYPKPDGEFTLLINDWWNKDNKVSNLLIFSVSSIYFICFQENEILARIHNIFKLAGITTNTRFGQIFSSPRWSSY